MITNERKRVIKNENMCINKTKRPVTGTSKMQEYGTRTTIILDISIAGSLLKRCERRPVDIEIWQFIHATEYCGLCANTDTISITMKVFSLTQTEPWYDFDLTRTIYSIVESCSDLVVRSNQTQTLGKHN